MLRKIEGLILKKVIYKDRHVIGHVLLRSGKKISVLFYGAQAGSKSGKAAILEVGHMLKIELQITRSTNQIYRAQEWGPIWTHRFIREDFSAFCVMCLMLEVSEKVASEDDLHDEHREHDKESLGIFNILSNSLFQIEVLLKKRKFYSHRSVMIFMAKLSFVQGVFPIRDQCVLSGDPIRPGDNVGLVFEDGGFALSSYCNPEHFMNYTNHNNRLYQMELWDLLGIIGAHQFDELEDLDIKTSANVRLFFNYFCYHFNYFETDFKSFNMYFTN